MQEGNRREKARLGADTSTRESASKVGSADTVSVRGGWSTWHPQCTSVPCRYRLSHPPSGTPPPPAPGHCYGPFLFN